MSGGHFNDSGYVYYQAHQFADELENEIEKAETNGSDSFHQYSKETIELLKQQVKAIRKTANIMRHIDYLYSGDIGEENLAQRISLEEEKD
jgi:archaellum component FlaC